MQKIMMVAGEPSGDLHGSMLAKELKALSPSLEILGTGGDKMKGAGCRLLFGLKDLAVTGLLNVIKHFSRLINIQAALLSAIKTEKIDLVILIDYPDFNLRLAKKIKAISDVPIIYYISPQIWAWRRGRIKIIKKYIRKMYVIFKFEEELYKKAGIPVEFIGHPLLDVVRPTLTRDEGRGTRDEKIIALLPGSRKNLIKKHLPIILETASIISRKHPDIKFLLSKSPSVNINIYNDALNKYKLPITLAEGSAYDTINAAYLVLSISGTATLETAILEKPMVIIYKLPAIEYMIAKPLLRLKNIGLVNIVAGKEVVPELIQSKARPEIIAEKLEEILSDKKRYDQIVKDLREVKSALYPSGASRRAASSIIKLM